MDRVSPSTSCSAAVDLGAMRATLGGLVLGEMALPEFGEPTDVRIRVQRLRRG